MNLLWKDCPQKTIGEYIVADAKRVNAGVIKAAAESAELTEFNITLLRAAAYAQRRLGLSIVLHTNAVNRNGRKAVEVLLNEGVAAKCIAVGHLSDTDDIDISEVLPIWVVILRLTGFTLIQAANI